MLEDSTSVDDQLTFLAAETLRISRFWQALDYAAKGDRDYHVVFLGHTVLCQSYTEPGKNCSNERWQTRRSTTSRAAVVMGIKASRDGRRMSRADGEATAISAGMRA